jgi:WD40 repeat protein
LTVCKPPSKDEALTMNTVHSLQALLNNTATEEDIALLKRLLANGEISIGGNVSQSILITGSGNSVNLTVEALDRLNARPMLGNLDRDLTGEEIASGLRRLDKLLPNRAPVLLPHYKEQVGRLRPTLKTEVKALSESARRERLEALAAINSICVEAVDISFNGLALGEAAPDYDARSPFRGLESFRPEDSKFFFGREALTRKLVAQIQAHPFLAVLGASGSGKSSLVMAGVIPALASDYVVFRPGTNPLDELESARGKSLIVVDQFEELFTLTRDESTRKDFIARLLDESSRARIILTLRSDFLGEVGAYRTLSAEIQNHLEIIPPMDMDELRRAMEGQAGVVGLCFEADLSQQILDDVAGEPGAMPLLQHALWELWNRRHGRNLRASEYRAFGGVKQAITSTAEKVYADCSKPEQDALRDIFLRLTRLDDGDEGRDTRRRVPLGDLIPSGRDAASITLLLDKLANARLVVKTVNADKTEVEVAHEALIRHWERLRIWLNEDRDALHLRESVSESAKEWEKSGKHESLLNSRWVKLDEALLLAQESRYRLTDIEQAYLKGGVALRNREQRERERRLRYTVFASIAAAIIFLVLGSFGWVKSNEATLRANDAAMAQAKAEEQAQISHAGELAAQSVSLLNKDFQLSLLTGIEAYQTYATVQSHGVLLDNTQTHPQLRAFLNGHTEQVDSVAFSPDGKTLASGSNDGTIILWDVVTQQPIGQPLTGTSFISSVAFSPDGKMLASGSWDGTVTLWDVSNQKIIGHSFTRHTGYISSVAFSPDGKIVASSSSDKTIILWDVATQKPISQPFVGTSFVSSVAFSPDGKMLASGNWDSKIILWDVITHKPIDQPLVGHTDYVSSVAFSPDGKTLASGSKDNTIILWDILTHTPIVQPFAGYTDPVYSVAFSPDGKTLASGSADTTIILWDVVTQKRIGQPFTGHTGYVSSVAFSPDGKTLASGSFDKKIILWDVAPKNPIGQPLTRHSDVAFSPDGKTLALGSEDNTVILWDVATQKPIGQPLTGHVAPVSSVVFSPNGKILASGSWDETVILWDIATQKPIGQPISGHTDVAFSPDSKTLALGSADTTIILWDVATQKPIGQPFVGTSFVSSVVFSPDGKTLASGNDNGMVILWDVLTQKPIGQPLTGRADIAFSPDGKMLASGNDNGMVILWDVLTQKPIGQPLAEHTAPVYSVVFSPDGKTLASGSADTTIILWDVATRHIIGQPLTGHIAPVTSMAFNPNGKTLASGSYSVNTVILWDIDPQSWIEKNCRRVGRNLTRAEWSQYIGDALPYQAVCPNLPIEP